MKNILKNIKSNPLMLGIIGSLIGGILILSSAPLVRFFLKLLFSWSNRFSRLIIDSTLKLAIMELKFIGYYTFMLVLLTLTLVLYLLVYPYLHTIKKQSEKKRQDIVRRTLIKGTMLLAILIMFIVLINSSAEFLNITQKLRMGIITPYIDDQKEEELWSKWYLIRSKIDYINLNSELDNIAENNKIELPKPYY